MEAPYPHLGPHRGPALDLARHARGDAGAWRAAIEAWQGPVVDDASLPAWYRAALFNELYFLVDGGTFWEAGEVGGPEPDADDPGRFALLECLDYPFYDTVDVDFYASAAIVELFPDLERRGIRDLLATVAGTDTTPVTIEASGVPGTRKAAFAVPHDVGGPDEDPFVRPNRYRFQDVNGWIDLAPKLALQVWRVGALEDERAVAEALAGGGGRRSAALRSRTPTATGCRTMAGSRTRRTTRGRCTGPPRTAVSSGWGALRQPRRLPGAMATAPPPSGGPEHTGGVVMRSRTSSGEGADGYYAYDWGGGGQLGQRHGGHARGAVVRGPVGPGRPDRPGPRQARPAHDPCPERCRLRRRAAGRRERDAPGRHGRHVERAEPGGLDRDELRPRGLHAGPRAGGG